MSENGYQPRGNMPDIPAGWSPNPEGIGVAIPPSNSGITVALYAVLPVDDPDVGKVETWTSSSCFPQPSRDPSPEEMREMIAEELERMEADGLADAVAIDLLQRVRDLEARVRDLEQCARDES